MCGKFTLMMTWREYCDLASVGTDGGRGGPDMMDPEKMLGTLTPMSSIPVVHLGPVRQRRVKPMRWGWYNHKLADPRTGFSHLHARAETIDSTPTWMDSFFERRGVVFTRQFNIGEELPDGKIKQWVCSRADGAPVAIAFLYSAWETITSGTLLTCAMVTTQSCAPLNLRDSRMPALLRGEEEVAVWLGEQGASDAELKALLRSYDGSLIMREQVSPKSKPPRNEPSPKKPKSPKPDPQPGLF